MKPEKLIICGWGPYKEETVVDFTKLNTSLFLITGQKSMIFLEHQLMKKIRIIMMK